MQEEFSTKDKRPRSLPAVKRYYVLHNDEQTGPMTLAQFQGYYRRKEIHPDDLFWTEGNEEWTPVATLENILKQPDIKNSPGRHARKKRHKPGIAQYFFITLAFLLFVAVIAFIVYWTGNML